ncbi:membrane protein insertase YidC [Paracoccus sp. SCSIO 75233]|uniref:membrane protein insertase YidC n=1 Tax=Paracoccus sp. SCSIO 75233 TaxID=3017782 RepID=UPI0022F0F1CF|nr:membrane protein insertase YidC [Paracoccus sp. SCSIO 75233]WBU54478.1 membrane protein insertase YidC [Paracoccus sp. SCSIO 75233]
MEDNNRNLILAMVLSMLVVLVWYSFFAPEPPPPAPVDETVQTETGAPATPAAPVTSGNAVTGGAAVAASDDVSATAARISIDSPSLEGSLSLAGGRIDDLLLKNYRETLDESSPDVRVLTPTVANQLNPNDPGLAGQKPYYVIYGWSPVAGADPSLVPGTGTVWEVESGDTLGPDSPVTLRWDNGAGQIFRRHYTLDDKFLFTVTQSVENTSDTPFEAAPYGIIARHGQPDTQNFFVLHEGMVAMTDGELMETKYKKMPDFDPVAGDGRAEIIDVAESGWIGFTDKYWMTTLAPVSGQPFRAVAKYTEGLDIYQTETRFPVITVAAGASASSESYLFAGAKEWETIRGYEQDPGIQRFVDSIDWGWFYFLTKPIFRLLHWLNGFLGNMGWSIIALTFILKALVFPLARKSYVSMARMRELQPQMEALKERVGDDRAKMQQEMMALYKKEKVNPAAGCLPILIQIPIFFSLYKVIFVTLELRHAPWIGWIRDLSAPDPSSILNLFGLLPYAAPARDSMIGIISLSVMAIILGISMWLQQKLNPAPADPTQKMIFAWMPWVFMFMLGGFASGLVLYWITNNVITILQQYTIMSMHGSPPNLFGNIRDSVRPKKKKE